MKQFFSTPLGKTLGILLLILLAIMLYGKLFPQSKLSDISDFSGYGSFVLALVTIFFYWKDKNQNAPYLEADRTPQVSFTFDERGIDMEDRFSDSVKIVNISKVPAMSISVRFRMNRNDEYCPWISCFDLQAGEKKELFWLRLPDSIQVAYSDRTRRHHFVTSYQDGKPIHDAISEDQFREYDAAAMANRFKSNSNLRLAYLRFVQERLHANNDDIDAVVYEYHNFYNQEIL